MTPQREIELNISYLPDQADLAAIGDGILAFNAEQIGQTAFRPLSITMRDRSDALIGGMFGDMRWGWLDLKALWVAPSSRRQGLGSRILHTAENQAQENGCHSVWLTTESFQAETFYARAGYEVFARLEDYPPGHKRIFMRKSLSTK